MSSTEAVETVEDAKPSDEVAVAEVKTPPKLVILANAGDARPSNDVPVPAMETPPSLTMPDKSKDPDSKPNASPMDDNGAAADSSKGNSTSATTETEPPAEHEETAEWKAWSDERKKLPKKVDVKWSNFEQFKNRYSPEEGLEIIEVLHGHAGLITEVTREKHRRSSRRSIARKTTSSAESRWIQRVRIQSPALLYFLSFFAKPDFNQETLPERSQVFFRPFCTFYYTLPLMKRLLEILRSKSALGVGVEGADGQAADVSDSRSPITAKDRVMSSKFPEKAERVEGMDFSLNMPPEHEVMDIIYYLEDRETAIQHLQKYVEFVTDHIVPAWNEAAGTTKTRIRFADLPMYYRPGDFLFAPKVSPKSSEKSKSMGTGATQVEQNIYRLSYIYPASLTRTIDNEPCDYRNPGPDSMTFSAYHIDFDGVTYGPSHWSFTIASYAGEKDIRSQKFYPLRFEKEAEKMKRELSERGKRFPSVIKEKHLYYDGWTMLHPADDDEDTGNAEHIEGNIIIDFKEGFQSDVSLTKPYLYSENDPSIGYWDEELDPLGIKHWSDSSRKKLLGETFEAINATDQIDILQWKAMKTHDRFLKANDSKDPWLKEYGTDLSSHFNDEELALMPQRLIAYSFRTREFFLANIDCITSIAPPKNTFKYLKINTNHQRLVKSLVESHFQKQKMRRSASSLNMDQDFIRGKGAGLVILLHGVPGVGKTTTAEAVALSNQKPLFTITSGDLGFTPRDVETSLQQTFRLAQLWDCVLLLDEADLFLSRREVEDLERNSLVSVFLRALEYYNGVLFLTTNRVGTIDEAFKSRIHLSLYYPPLSCNQTLEIFDMNIRRLKEIETTRVVTQAKLDENEPHDQPTLEIDERRIMQFAKMHFDSHSDSQRWNGRQIRNAFQVAYSLAQCSMQNGDDTDDEGDSHPAGNGTTASKTTLDDQQFLTISETIERFDNYLSRTRGLDADRARNSQVRYDGYRDYPEEDHFGRGRRFPSTSRPGDHMGYLVGQAPDPRYSDMRVPESRFPNSMYDAPRHATRPSLSGGIDSEGLDDGRGPGPKWNQQYQPSPQPGVSRLPMRPAQHSAHLSPDGPGPRVPRDPDYAIQAASNGEDFPNEDRGYRSYGMTSPGSQRRSPRYSPGEAIGIPDY